ncbi:DUF368 domain-containing protein [Marinimicrobium agarilyticum]|uniref:DUF368 domain-containing protein n=1 Tax=Marinimicrobium agarilyticum TaxID=306546 RepID=UPI00040ACCCC|nr:DUF368 domain-containing protein [Marinimicrobium agarilyticum]
MGAADVVPGVSGGTIAFISGIYDELLDSLRRWTPAALGIWYREGFGAFWKHTNGNFLLTVFGGVLLSIFSLANVVSYALEYHPLLVWGFFFGLVVASVVYIGRGLALRSPQVWIGLAVGTVVALAISLGKPMQLPDEWWMVFLAGSIAICAMILPGVSGSFLLLLMGMYPVFIQAVADLNWLILGCFLAGCVTGLLLFSHFLSWLLHRFREQTLAVLTGFLIGSLNIIWPWKHALQTFVDRHGEEIPVVQENLWPTDYAAVTGNDPQTAMVLVLMALGLFLVLGLEHWATQNDEKRKAL